MPKAEGEKSSKVTSAELKPVQLRTGISDGILTEVLEGLEGGETVVVGTTSPTPTGLPTGASNPLGGRGGGRGGGGFRGF
jgi:HlyD family secretion protein